MPFKKYSIILRSKKAYGLKILQSIIHVKEYFYIFLSRLKDILSTQNQLDHWIS